MRIIFEVELKRFLMGWLVLLVVRIVMFKKSEKKMIVRMLLFVRVVIGFLGMIVSKWLMIGLGLEVAVLGVGFIFVKLIFLLGFSIVLIFRLMMLVIKVVLK